MDDLKQHKTRLQVFYSFVSNFETLHKTVREMALSGDPADYVRAEGICDLVGFFVYEAQNLQEVKDRIMSQPIDGQLKGLVVDMNQQMMNQKDSIFLQMIARHQILLDILLLRSTIRPSEVRQAEKDAEQAVRDALTDKERDSLDRRIKLRKGIPIEGETLEVLNEIAAAVTSKDMLLSDYVKRFKTPQIRDIIIQVYHESPYYFEQAFSNTSINIQFILLEIIAESMKKDPKNEQKKEIYRDLIDLHTLATIDTTANKMTSKVSDHQAFELFLNALYKSNNDFLIKKLLNDDVIMNTLFDISTRDLENYYGFRRMFTVARHPFDGIIVERYKKLKHLSDAAFSHIVKDLSRDQAFKESWERYLKTEKTGNFIRVLDESKTHLLLDTLSDEVVYGLVYVLKEFSLLDDYNTDILSMELVMTAVEDMYYFIIRNKAFGQYPDFEEALEKFYHYRVNNALNASRLQYKNFGGENTFSVIYSDMWFDIHRMMYVYGYQGDKFYLTYEEDTVYTFETGERIRLYEEKFTSRNIKGLPKGHHNILCINKDAKGFDHYMFTLFGRIVRTFMSGAIQTRLLSVKTSAFRKTEIPGLSVKDEQRVRKVILDYLTLLSLWEKNKHLFIHVYRQRIGPLLRAITAMEMDNKTMGRYVNVTLNAWVLDLFSYTGMVNRMTTDWEMIGRSDQTLRMLEHGRSFFELASKNKVL